MCIHGREWLTNRRGGHLGVQIRKVMLLVSIIYFITTTLGWDSVPRLLSGERWGGLDLRSVTRPVAT